jgi:hypothetical protein
MAVLLLSLWQGRSSFGRMEKLMRLGVAAVAASSVVALLMPAAVAGDSASVVRGEQSTTRLRFTFEHGESLRPGTTVVDSAGKPNNGKVLSANGGRLTRVKHRSGHAAQFPDRCLQQGCPRAIISTPSRKSLNARGRQFSFGAQVRVAPNRAPASTSTIIQKGSPTAAKRWRLRINRPQGKPYCHVSGTKGLLRMHSRVGIADGRWHRLKCSRQGRSVRLFVDGDLVAERTGPIGRVSNRGPVRVGGTSTITKNNQFFGRLDNVYLRIRR